SEGPADRSEEAVFREGRFGSRIHEKEGAGPVGAFRVAGTDAGLAEESGLLVSEDAGDRNAVGKEADALRFREGSARRQDLGPDRLRDSERGAKRVVERALFQVEAKRARRIRRLGHVRLVRGEFRDEEGV